MNRAVTGEDGAASRGGGRKMPPLRACRLFKRFSPEQLLFVLATGAIFLALTLYRYFR